MKCPHCNKELDILARCYINVETYSPHKAIVTTECCGKLINLERVLNFKITKYNGNNTEDDWGVKAR